MVDNNMSPHMHMLAGIKEERNFVVGSRRIPTGSPESPLSASHGRALVVRDSPTVNSDSNPTVVRQFRQLSDSSDSCPTVPT